jgi:hypothetical protein
MATDRQAEIAASGAGGRGGKTAPSGRAARSGGAEGNERLTVMTGAVLLILLAVECYTILRIGRLLTLHVFLGMLLLGPVTLKAGSVLYRFARYYTGSAPYRRMGPPALLLRVLGPVIMLSTACVFGSGIMLAVTGPSYGYGGSSGWLVVHRISFFAWIFFIVIHVVAYVPRLPRLLAAEARRARRAMEVLGGRGARLALLIASPGAPVKLAELVLLVQRRRRVNFHRLLERGLERQVLRPAGAYYQFRDAPLQDYLAAGRPMAERCRPPRTRRRLGSHNGSQPRAQPEYGA